MGCLILTILSYVNKPQTILLARDGKSWQLFLVGTNLLWAKLNILNKIKLNEYCKNLVPNRDLERLD